MYNVANRLYLALAVYIIRNIYMIIKVWRRRAIVLYSSSGASGESPIYILYYKNFIQGSKRVSRKLYASVPIKLKLENLMISKHSKQSKH